MPAHGSAERLCDISTAWTVLREAHAAFPAAACAAQEVLFQRYAPAVYRYLLALTRDPATAEELTQEFALGLARGEFRHADPGCGRFRDYLKSALGHLAARWRKRLQRQPRLLADAGRFLEDQAAALPDSDARFDEAYRDELLAQVWAQLAHIQPIWYAVLRCRADHPTMSSPEMARLLSQLLNRPMTAEACRQNLHRARQAFAELLLDDLARGLGRPAPEKLEEELGDLNLLEYCRPALERRRKLGAQSGS